MAFSCLSHIEVAFHQARGIIKVFLGHRDLARSPGLLGRALSSAGETFNVNCPSLAIGGASSARRPGGATVSAATFLGGAGLIHHFPDIKMSPLPDLPETFKL